MTPFFKPLKFLKKKSILLHFFEFSRKNFTKYVIPYGQVYVTSLYADLL